MDGRTQDESPDSDDSSSEDGNGDRTGDDGTDERSHGDETSSYPRGLSEDGVSPLLADNHERNLRGSSFEFEYTLVNYTEGWERPATTARVDDGTARVEGGGIGTETFLRNDLTEVLWTLQYRGDRLYGIVDSSHGGGLLDLGDIVFSDHLRGLLRSVSFEEVEPVERAGETMFRIRGATVDDPAPAVDQLAIGGLSGADVEGYVDRDGIVHSLEAELEYARDGEANLADFVYEVGDIGETSVDEPDWVPTAEERAPTLSLEQSDDGTYFRLEHEGGQSLPANTVIQQTGDPHYTTLDRELESGEVLYFWFEGDQPRKSRDAPPEEATVIENGIIEVTLESVAYLSVRIRHL